MTATDAVTGPWGTVEEAWARRTELRERQLKLQADLSAINAQEPPKSRDVLHHQWATARTTKISEVDAVQSEHQRLRTWLELYAADGRMPSQLLMDAAKRIRFLEQLYGAVSDYLQTDSDEDYDKMRVAHARLGGRIDGDR